MTRSSRRRSLTRLLSVPALTIALLLTWLPMYLTVQAQSDPTAAQNLRAEVLPGEGVALSWDAPAENAESITGYEILRRRPNRGENSLLSYVGDTESNATTYTDLDATEPEEQYVYRVVALRGSLSSGRSNFARVVVSELGPVELEAVDEKPPDAVALTAPAIQAKDAVPRADTNMCTPPPTPTDVTVEAVPIVVTSTTDDYFVLYVKHDVDGVEMEAPVAVVRGEAGTITLSENVAALPKSRYRVEKYLISDPADVDRDCIDDITELGNPVTMNPVNPAGQLALSDGAVAIHDRSTFEVLSLEKSGRGYLKFSLFGMNADQPRLWFQNADKYRHHVNFLNVVGLMMDEGYVRGELTYDPNMVAANGSQGVYRFWIADQFFVTQYSLELVTRVYTLLAASMPLLTDNLAFMIPTPAAPTTPVRYADVSGIPNKPHIRQRSLHRNQLRGNEPGRWIRLPAKYGTG